MCCARRSPDVLNARTGNLLWIGALIGLWTVGSLIETIRDILRRAYGTRPSKPFWHYRLSAIGIIFLSVLGAMFALALQVMLGAAEAVVERLFPFADSAIGVITASRLVPTLLLFAMLYMLFVALTPGLYRARRVPEMARRGLHGALVVRHLAPVADHTFPPDFV